MEFGGEPGASYNKSVLRNGSSYAWPTNGIFTEAGTYTVTATQTDQAGNISVVSEPFTFTIEPEYMIQYFADEACTISLGDNPVLTAGTYYIQIVTNRQLASAPVITIDAEGDLNDVACGATVQMVSYVYLYTRVIVSDPAAGGAVKETIRIDGEPPVNETVKAGYLAAV